MYKLCTNYAKLIHTICISCTFMHRIATDYAFSMLTRYQSRRRRHEVAAQRLRTGRDSVRRLGLSDRNFCCRRCRSAAGAGGGGNRWRSSHPWGTVCVGSRAGRHADFPIWRRPGGSGEVSLNRCGAVRQPWHGRTASPVPRAGLRGLRSTGPARCRPRRRGDRSPLGCPGRAASAATAGRPSLA
jgi:hypothetical protein